MEEIIFIGGIIASVAGPRTWAAPIYSVLVIPIVQWLFYCLPYDRKMQTSGTWSSLCSEEHVFGSKFLLFSMTFLCLTVKDVVVGWVGDAQILLLLVGLFPSTLDENDDDFIIENRGPTTCQTAKRITSEIIHVAASVAWGIIMLAMYFSWLALSWTVALVIMQVTIMIMQHWECHHDRPKTYIAIQHLSILVECLLMNMLIMSACLNRWYIR